MTMLQFIKDFSFENFNISIAKGLITLLLLLYFYYLDIFDKILGGRKSLSLNLKTILLSILILARKLYMTERTLIVCLDILLILMQHSYCTSFISRDLSACLSQIS